MTAVLPQVSTTKADRVDYVASHGERETMRQTVQQAERYETTLLMKPIVGFDALHIKV